ncbi:MAG TPA: hypothetical protein VLS90_01490 [Thermodesulfobacteriota bacterium]|nr:hypothetical protein [Thermodesulfobacteriota bacterium]
MKTALGIAFLLLLAPTRPDAAEVRNLGEEQVQGVLSQEDEQSFKIAPVKPGQTIQAYLSINWAPEARGNVEWVLADQGGATLRTAHHYQPEAATALIEWTSNSEPRPRGYLLHVRGKGGKDAGEILGEYTVRVFLWDQNDGGQGTDAPEDLEKAMELPVAEAGSYSFPECYLSGTADTLDVYKVSVKPNHDLTLKARPILWSGKAPKSKIKWEFLNRSFKKMKDGQSSFAETSPFTVKIFHPQVRSSNRPALFYLRVALEGDSSLVYSLDVDVKERR